MNNRNNEYDAVVVGSGPNGLTAAIRLASKKLNVLVLEAEKTIGGGTRTKELTEAGFKHDVCSAVHPTAVSSPYFNQLDLGKYGLEWIHPPYPFAHPLNNHESVVVSRSLEETATNLGIDNKAYHKLYDRFVADWGSLSEDIFGPLRVPAYPLKMARFGLSGLPSASTLSTRLFNSPRSRALFAGCAAHSILPLDKLFTSSFGIVLGASAHAVGWPIAKGGSASITDALAKLFKSLGGNIVTNKRVADIQDIPSAKAVLFDLTPQQIQKILADKLPSSYRSKLVDYRYGPGVFKIDFALSEAVPWKDKQLLKAGTLHLGESLEEIMRSEQNAWQGRHSDTPYVLLSQPSLFDPERAPEGKHTLWAYCHVPNGSERDMSQAIEQQIERYAPGFKDTIINKHTMNTSQLEVYNSNYIGGDINGGAQMIQQLFARPVLKWDPYSIPLKGYYICSSSTPPGGGVHGMCGYHAAASVLKKEFGLY
ncbi:MAG: NAD(P)/FAD-dependent oxidoreductase [Balneolaceae bacterium]|nr:NAD(P)/FAD-dependent oxidoreductase [Balneolaceae bacterium]